MTDQQIHLVKKTWRLLRGVDPELLGDVFYRRLFLLSPSLKPLFKGPLSVQYHKFVMMLNIIVALVDKPHELRAEMAALASRHQTYGVQPADYELVGQALLWTLEQGLGSHWNKEVNDAWHVCYDTVVETMQVTR